MVDITVKKVMKMPVEGWKAVTINKEIHDKAKKYMIEKNAEAGAKVVFRSMTHLVELAILEYLEKRKKEGK